MGALSMEPIIYIIRRSSVTMITGFVKLYRENGLNVMPLKPKSKFPYKDADWKKYQLEKYTGDFKSDENGAVICGKTSGGLIVIDLDDKALATEIFPDFEGLKKKTIVIETGKGYHIYIHSSDGSVPDTSIRTVNEKGQRVDIQCQGTYALIPGSVHPDTGEEYKMISDTLNIEGMSLDKFIIKLGELGFNIEGRRKKIVDVLKGVGEGERNDSGFRLAMCARHFWDLKGTELLAILTEWNQKYVFPPMSDLEIKNIVNSAMSYEIDQIKFKDIIDEVKKPLTELNLKYDDKFWKEIEDHCKKAGVSRTGLLFHCDSCGKDMVNDPQNEDHKTHFVTIKYK